MIRVDGYVMHVPDDMRWAFPAGRYFERNVDHWFTCAMDVLCPRVVFDVGANYGYYTLRAAAVGAVVVAFEPTRKTFEVLEGNVQVNNIDEVVLRRVALSDVERWAKLARYSSSGNNSIVRRAPEKVAHLRADGFEWVPTTTIDHVLRTGVPRPQLLKIDAEGAELRIVRGATDLLGSDPPVIVMEHDESIAADAGYGLSDVVALLKRHDYRLEALRSDPQDLGLYPLDALDPADIAALLCSPPSVDITAAR